MCPCEGHHETASQVITCIQDLVGCRMMYIPDIKSRCSYYIIYINLKSGKHQVKAALEEQQPRQQIILTFRTRFAVCSFPIQGLACLFVCLLLVWLLFYTFFTPFNRALTPSSGSKWPLAKQKVAKRPLPIEAAGWRANTRTSALTSVIASSNKVSGLSINVKSIKYFLMNTSFISSYCWFYK